MRAFLFKPYGDYDLEYAKDLQIELDWIMFRCLEKFWRIEDTPQTNLSDTQQMMTPYIHWRPCPSRLQV